jgi:hypothetical protein
MTSNGGLTRDVEEIIRIYDDRIMHGFDWVCPWCSKKFANGIVIEHDWSAPNKVRFILNLIESLELFIVEHAAECDQKPAVEHNA